MIMVVTLFINLVSCSSDFSTVNLSDLSNPEAESTVVENVVFGEDDRENVREEKSLFWKNKILATAAIIDSRELLKDGDFYYANFISSEEQAYCESEKFSEEKALSNCTAFLVAPDLVMTAGHCTSDFTYDYFGNFVLLESLEKTCGKTKFVFDYTLESNFYKNEKIEKDKVYSCVEVLSHSFDGVLDKPDYSLIRLDRKVEGIEPFKLVDHNETEVGDELTVISHPHGKAKKISHGGFVKGFDDIFINSDVDVNTGSSGGPLILSESGAVIGIVSNGPRPKESIKYNLDFTSLCYVEKPYSSCTNGDCNSFTNLENLGDVFSEFINKSFDRYKEK